MSERATTSFLDKVRAWLGRSPKSAAALGAIVVASALAASSPPSKPEVVYDYERVRIPGTDRYRSFNRSDSAQEVQLLRVRRLQLVIQDARRQQLDMKARGEPISPELDLTGKGSLPLPAERAVLRSRNVLLDAYVIAGLEGGKALVENAVANGAARMILRPVVKAVADPVVRRVAPSIADPFVDGATRAVTREAALAAAERRAAAELERKAATRAAESSAGAEKAAIRRSAEVAERAETPGLVGALSGEKANGRVAGPLHTSSRLGGPTSAELERLRRANPGATESELRAAWYYEKQSSTAGLTLGEAACARELSAVKGAGFDGCMVDLVKRERSGLKVPVEVKDQNVIHLDGEGNSAFRKFENIARNANMAEISHFEVLGKLDSRLPPNFRVRADGVLERLESGTREWTRVTYGGKEVRIRRADLGTEGH